MRKFKLNAISRQLAVFLCLFSSSAFAQEIKLDLGLTQFTSTANGNWYQKGFAHTLRLTSLSGALKLYTEKYDGWQFGIGADYIGRATSDAMVLDDDANYNENSPTHCNGSCGPLSHMQGQGTIPAALIAVRKTWDKWFVDTALYATRPHWETINYDWYGGPNNSVGPLVSKMNHAPETVYGIGLSVGYVVDSNLAVVFSVKPTHTSGLVQNSATQFPGIYKAYSPGIALEYTF
jgi:hypothetical protein